MSKINLCVIEFAPLKTYAQNLQKLLNLYSQTSSNMALTSELILTGFDYDNFEAAASFFNEADKKFKKQVTKTALVLTAITKKNNKFFNTMLVYHENKLIFSRHKERLFLKEARFFSKPAKLQELTFELFGIKFGTLICFELRFSSFYQALQDAQIILFSAAWPSKRITHLKALSHSLAILNHAFLLRANACGTDYEKTGAIISPNGNIYQDKRKNLLEKQIDLNEIYKIKKSIGKI